MVHCLRSREHLYTSVIVALAACIFCERRLCFILSFQLKGCAGSKVSEEVDNMIGVLHLEDKRDTAAKQLSGGMKRKLCVGIALIADSKVNKTPRSNVARFL